MKLLSRSGPLIWSVEFRCLPKQLKKRGNETFSEEKTMATFNLNSDTKTSRKGENIYELQNQRDSVDYFDNIM